VTKENTIGFTIAVGLASGGVIFLNAADIQQFYFIEDIFSFCMVGKMIIEDRFGIVEYGPLTGNERIMLSYGDEKSRRIVFNIIKISKVTMSSPTISTDGTQLAIYFVDTTYKNMTKKKFSKSWSNTNALTIMNDIIVNMGESEGDLNKILLKRYDDTDTNLSLVMPYWTPMEAIQWINKRTKPKGSKTIGKNLGGYLYYNNTYWDTNYGTNKDNNFTAAWKSINSLFSEPANIKSDWKDPLVYVFSGGEKGGDDPTYVNKILDWRYGGIDYSYSKKLQGGRMLSFNFDGKTFIDRTYKYSKKNDKQGVNWGMIDTITLLGNKSLFVDISERDSNINITSEINTNILDNMFYHEWLRRYSVQQTLSIIVKGWEKRFAGKMIELNWPSSERTNKAGNENVKGPYLIKSITHNFGTKQGYTQRIVLLKNAYYRSRNDSLIDATIKNTGIDQSLIK